MAEDGTRADDTSVEISGTLDAISLYVAKNYGLSQNSANKATTLIWLEQECDLARELNEHEINGSLKSLSEFDSRPEDGYPAQGMVFNSRVFLSVSKLKAEAYCFIPSMLIDFLLGSEKLSVKVVKLICSCVLAVMSAKKVVPDGLSCVCLRAWNSTNGEKNIPFYSKNLLPLHERADDKSSPFVCEFTQDDGTQRIGHASFDCPFHSQENYCKIDEEKVRAILATLEELNIIEKHGVDGYRFL